MFLIRKINYYGENVETSSIEFKDGLNIVYGPSNTGKTYIVESIDYMFGGEDFPLSDDCGYTVIEIEIETSNGSLTMSRSKEDNFAKVISTIPDLPSKEYYLKPGNGKIRKDTISDVWLHLLGILDPINIYQTEDLKTQAFTTRAFNQVFIVKEDYIHQKDTIIKKGNKNITAIKAALLYLLNSNNYIVDDEEDNKTKSTKRKALELYISEQLGFISSKREELKKNASVNIEEAKKQIDDAVTELDTYETKMNQLLHDNSLLFKELNYLNSNLSENKTLSKKYIALQTQYSSDLKRLNLIIDGEVHKGQIKKTTRCPFCNGELDKKEEESCVDAAKVEIENLLPKIQDLKFATSELDLEINNLNEKISNINLKKENNNNLINSDIKPKIFELKNLIVQLTKSIEDSKEAELLLEFEDRYKGKLNELTNEGSTVTKFEPNDLFGTAFIDEMNNLIDDMLLKSNYENYQSSYFDINKFDVVVNGQSKKTQGKGFRAFLNTSLAFSLHSYMKAHASHFMNLFVIDSPILTLREKDDDAERNDKMIANTMKNGLMEYFVNNSEGRQIIIIENEIPNINYKDANVIHFTKTSVGRYGLLKSIKQ